MGGAKSRWDSRYNEGGATDPDGSPGERRSGSGPGA